MLFISKNQVRFAVPRIFIQFGNRVSIDNCMKKNYSAWNIQQQKYYWGSYANQKL